MMEAEAKSSSPWVSSPKSFDEEAPSPQLESSPWPHTRSSRMPWGSRSSTGSTRKLYLGSNDTREDFSYKGAPESATSSTFIAAESLDFDENAPRSRGPRASSTFLQKSLSCSNWWLYELLAMFLSVASLITVIALLMHYNGKPTQQWAYGITLNGVVAALATVTRTALMIPTATALSQSKWLWFTSDKNLIGPKRLQDLETFDSASRGSLGSFRLLWRLKGCHVASIGALITILSLSYDTFMQQVLGTKVESMLEVTGIARISRSETYASYTHENNLSSFIPTWSVLNSIQSGIITENATFPSATCSSGNCTFPVVPTLGVCGGCTDTTWNKTCSTGYAKQCNYTMPDGNSITVDNSIQVNMFQVTTTSGLIYNASSETIPYIANFDVIGMPWQTQFWNEDQLVAKECALWMCVQAYNITVRDNIQTQEQIMTWNTTKPVGQSNVIAYHNFTGMPAEMHTQATSNYSVYGLSLIALHSGISGILTGSAAGGAEGLAYQGSFIEAIWSWNNTEKMVANLARSMTSNFMINSAVASNATTEYDGKAFTQDTFVSVRWKWMSMPILLVLLAVIWLAICVAQTHNSSVMAWKDSPLALLFLEADHRMKNHSQEHIDRHNGIETAVGKAEVTLRRDHGGWAFKSKI
ncbi:hypothetical protein BP6252_03650 [Coleophoma cylindrospora]|uniref:Uncharacterized protein n=1 Tax=Coleophoma cylindrospora TaxID=1849047 RepID=A0A3D8S9R3_9HELO|nr:hypothetical protein BP6252_03650 [Coleophoma cylindrospora]